MFRQIVCASFSFVFLTKYNFLLKIYPNIEVWQFHQNGREPQCKQKQFGYHDDYSEDVCFSIKNKKKVHISNANFSIAAVALGFDILIHQCTKSSKCEKKPPLISSTGKPSIVIRHLCTYIKVALASVYEFALTVLLA